MSQRNLLEKCLGGHTQNANNSFNSTVRRLAPKHLNCGKKIIEITIYIAAEVFNEGYYAILKIMDMLNIKIGQQCKFFTDNQNAKRINQQEQHS